MTIKHRVISDTHFGHQLLIDIWDRVTWYEKKIRTSLQSLGEWDILYHIGDICIGNDSFQHAEYIKPLKCRKVLILGNHDRKPINWYLNNGWDMVVDSLTIHLFGKEIMFVHIPTQETLDWATAKEERVVIHGHYHKHGREGRLALVKHILYSCEYEDMQARTVQYMLEKLS